MPGSTVLPPCCHAASEIVAEAPVRNVPAQHERVSTTTPALAERLAQRHEPESLPSGPCQTKPQQEHPSVTGSGVAPEAESCTRWPFPRHVDPLLQILQCDGPSRPSANRKPCRWTPAA